jgi:hypothetical protein
MSSQDRSHARHRETGPAPHDLFDRPVDQTMLRMLAVIALLGISALLGSNVAGSIMVPNHDWVADTVSDLAAGSYEWIQDYGLYGYAATLFAAALGLSHLRLDGKLPGLSVVSLAMLGALVTVVGARNEYGDGDNDGVVIHIYLVYGLGVLFTVVFAAMVPGLRRFRRIYGHVSTGCAVAWGVGAPVFFLLPTAWDGLWERGLGVITCIWTAMFAVALLDAARIGGMDRPAD